MYQRRCFWQRPVPVGHGASDGNRTRVTSLEGWGSTVELHLQMAERVGFEPTDAVGIPGFQDRFLKPLGHLSECNTSEELNNIRLLSV